MFQQSRPTVELCHVYLSVLLATELAGLIAQHVEMFSRVSCNMPFTYSTFYVLFGMSWGF